MSSPLCQPIITSSHHVVRGRPEASIYFPLSMNLSSCTYIASTSCTNLCTHRNISSLLFHSPQYFHIFKWCWLDRPRPCCISSQYQWIGEPSRLVQTDESERRRQCKAFGSASVVKMILLRRPSVFGRRFYATLEPKLTSTSVLLGM